MAGMEPEGPIMRDAMKENTLLPAGITSMRLVAVPFLLCFLHAGEQAPFLALFLFSASTDIVDGYVARRLNVVSRKGAYFDSIADFCVILGVFLVWAAKSVVPYWIPAILIFSFSLFMITSLRRVQIYDPVGKCFGCLIYATIPLLTTAPALNEPACLLIALFFAASMASRAAYLLFFRQPPGPAKGQETEQG